MASSSSSSPIADDEAPGKGLHLNRELLAEGEFFKLGEIREPRDADFEHFLRLATQHDNWTLKHDKNSVKVWMRDIPGQTVKMLKMFGHFSTVSASVLYDTVMDSGYRSNWDEVFLTENTICLVEGTDSELGYYSMKCPTPLRSRDFVYQRCWRVVEDKEYITFNHSVAHQDYPPTRQFIRGISMVTGFVIREADEGCTACYVTHSDPRGKVPKWLLNLIASRIAPRIFFKIMRAAEAYPEWKSQNSPDYKPWISPEKYNIPTVPVSSLLQFTEEDIPLTPRLGEPDFLGDEAHLEDTDVAPAELNIDPILLQNGASIQKEVMSV